MALIADGGGGAARTPWKPQQIDWRNPFKIPEQYRQQATLPDDRMRWLPGRVLLPEEQAGYMPAWTPFESYEQSWARAFGPIAETRGPEARMSSTEAAHLREKTFEQAGVTQAARERLRTTPVFATAPDVPWGSGYTPAGRPMGRWGEWGVIAQNPAIRLSGGVPELTHEYAHTLEYPRGPEFAQDFYHKAHPYVYAASQKQRAGEPLQMYEQAILGAADYAEWVTNFLEDETRYAPEFYAELARQLGGEVWRLPSELRLYYQGLFETTSPSQRKWGNSWPLQ